MEERAEPIVRRAMIAAGLSPLNICYVDAGRLVDKIRLDVTVTSKDNYSVPLSTLVSKAIYVQLRCTAKVKITVYWSKEDTDLECLDVTIMEIQENSTLAYHNSCNDPLNGIDSFPSRRRRTRSCSGCFSSPSWPTESGVSMALNRDLLTLDALGVAPRSTSGKEVSGCSVGG